MEEVRGRMGLPALDDATREHLWNAMFAAAEDINAAFAFVCGNAARFGVDPGRVAIGGFSSGALSAVNAAYGLGTPAKAVVALSGGAGAYDLGKTAVQGMPPALFFLGQNDLLGIQLATRAALASLAAVQVPVQSAWVPGFGHFYPMGAVSLGSDMSRMPVAARVLAFLGQTLGK